MDCFDDWKEDIIKYPTTWNVDTILPIMEVGGCVSGSELGGTWPRDFYVRGFECVATVPYPESTPALLNSRLPSAVDECTRNTVATKQ
jgi:hypothetical protein